MQSRPSHKVKNIDGVTHFIPHKQRRLNINIPWRRTLVLFIIIAVICSAIIALRQLQAPPNLETAEGVKQVLSKHMVLPNEQPVIATVTDRSALKTPFLKEAQDGDKIIIYEKARKVVIYRSSVDRIVNIGPVELNNIPSPNR